MRKEGHNPMSKKKRKVYQSKVRSHQARLQKRGQGSCACCVLDKFYLSLSIDFHPNLCRRINTPRSAHAWRWRAVGKRLWQPGQAPHLASVWISDQKNKKTKKRWGKKRYKVLSKLTADNQKNKSENRDFTDLAWINKTNQQGKTIRDLVADCRCSTVNLQHWSLSKQL